MRKMFRMAYESCSGSCYAYSDVMRIHNLGLDAEGAAAFLKRLLAMHAPSCGNGHLAFRLDVDDDLGVFVASFQRYGALDLFADKTPLGAMNKLIDGALAFYATNEYKLAIAALPGHGPAACQHGDDKKLVNFAIAFSGLSDAEQAELRAQFAS
jgi:hypothetical protein